jgi:hypothetical protein
MANADSCASVTIQLIEVAEIPDSKTRLPLLQLPAAGAQTQKAPPARLARRGS